MELTQRLFVWNFFKNSESYLIFHSKTNVLKVFTIFSLKACNTSLIPLPYRLFFEQSTLKKIRNEKKIFKKEFCCNFKKVSAIQTYLSGFYLSSQFFNLVSHFLGKLDKLHKIILNRIFISFFSYFPSLTRKVLQVSLADLILPDICCSTQKTKRYVFFFICGKTL